jgi:hypothetical protein
MQLAPNQSITARADHAPSFLTPDLEWASEPWEQFALPKSSGWMFGRSSVGQASENAHGRWEAVALFTA